MKTQPKQTMTKQEAIWLRKFNGEIIISSLMIADATGKAHGDVIKSIESTFEKHSMNEKEFASTYIDGLNRKRKHYLLPETEFKLFTSRYSTKHKTKLLEKLTQYEANKKSLPSTTVYDQESTSQLQKGQALTLEEATSIKEINGEPVMSSLRIAEITNKIHKNVNADIMTMFKELKIDELKFQLIYLDRNNRHQNHFLLPERELQILISGYSISHRATLIDELMSYRKNKVAPRPLTTSELLALSTEALEKSEAKRIEITKMLEQSEIIADATKYSNDTFSVDEFCKIISSKLQNVALGRTSCYKILRSIGLVEKTSTRPSQRGMQLYLDYRSHDHGFSTRVHRDKADQLIVYMVRHLQENPELNEVLRYPLGEV